MRSLDDESIDLIYIDPPYFSQKNYGEFDDCWQSIKEYLDFMIVRLYEMKRLLKPTGSIYVHLDWHAVHYVKVEMDKIFGSGGINGDEAGFKCEIVWCYSIGGRSKNVFGRKHDAILWYTKGKNWKFNSDDPRIRVLRKPNSHMKIVVDENGITWQEKTDRKTGKKYHYPLDKVPEDYWTDIEQLNREDAERVGYPTQKPERLIERIILASSDEGDVIADFFCGGGTTPVVAQRFNRRWIACDKSSRAIELTKSRLNLTKEDCGNEPTTQI